MSAAGGVYAVDSEERGAAEEDSSCRTLAVDEAKEGMNAA